MAFKRVEISYGFIPVFKNVANNQYFVFIIKQVSGNHWTFPKGHSEPSDATPLATSIRELKEETGFHESSYEILPRESSSSPFITNSYTKYNSRNEPVDKTNGFWIALFRSMENPPRVQAEEVLDCKWTSFQDALEIITYEEDRNLLRKTQEYLLSTSFTLK